MCAFLCVEDPGQPSLQRALPASQATEGSTTSFSHTKLLQLLYRTGAGGGAEGNDGGEVGGFCSSISVPLVSACREPAIPATAVTIMESALITWAQENGEGRHTMLSLCLTVRCLEPKTSRNSLKIT